jgi:nucleotide-binding universal stress UspA family protein
MKTNSTVRVDEDKNRIYLFLEGFHDLDEAVRMREAYREAIASCRPGFTVLADVTRYKPGAAQVQEVHAEAVQLAEDAGVRAVARVVGETPLGGMQIDRIARTEGGYEARNFATYDEAEAFLDSLIE